MWSLSGVFKQGNSRYTDSELSVVSAASSQRPRGKQQAMESEQAGTDLIWQVFKEGCGHCKTTGNIFPEL